MVSREGIAAELTKQYIYTPRERCKGIKRVSLVNGIPQKVCEELRKIVGLSPNNLRK